MTDMKIALGITARAVAEAVEIERARSAAELARLRKENADMLGACRDLGRLGLVIESAVRNADPMYRDEVVVMLKANLDALAMAEASSILAAERQTTKETT